MTNPQHSSETTEHGTPSDVALAAHTLMGGIDLDPATSPSFNRVVRAKRTYTEADNGFPRTWKGKVFLNPPGGFCDGAGKRVIRVKGKGYVYPSTEMQAQEHYSSMCLWWFRLAGQWATGSVEQAVFIGFSIEVLQRTQMYRALFPRDVVPMEMPFCVPKTRIPFNTVHDDGTLVPGKSPTHANVIVWLPPKQLKKAQITRQFKAAFGQFGEVK